MLFQIQKLNQKLHPLLKIKQLLLRFQKKKYAAY